MNSRIFWIAGFFPATFTVIASYAGCDRLLVVVCLLTATAFKGNYYPGMRVNALDLSPNYAGTIMAISNGAAALSGIVVPTFIGYMTPNVRHLIIEFGNASVNSFLFKIHMLISVNTWTMEICILVCIWCFCTEDNDLFDLGISGHSTME